MFVCSLWLWYFLIILTIFESSLSPHKKKTLSKLDPLWQNFLDPRMSFLTVFVKCILVFIAHWYRRVANLTHITNTDFFWEVILALVLCVYYLKKNPTQMIISTSHPFKVFNILRFWQIINSVYESTSKMQQGRPTQVFLRMNDKQPRQNLPELTVKPVLSGRSKEDQILVFKTDYRLMQVKSIAECSKRAFFNTFNPSISYHLSLRPVFCLFLSGRFTQVLLYINEQIKSFLVWVKRKESKGSGCTGGCGKKATLSDIKFCFKIQQYNFLVKFRTKTHSNAVVNVR